MLLNGVKVLAFTEYGAGSMIGSLLASMGAEVYKIEDPRTDGCSGRKISPGRVGNDSLFFEQVNQGVKSVVVDIKTESGKKIIEKMIRSVDAVISNRRTSFIDKHGLTFEKLKEVNSKLVCCYLTGYGRSGELKNEPAYDYLLQARYGIMSLTGAPDELPTRSFSAFIDFSGALIASMLVVAGLYQANKNGIGCQLDTSLMDAAVCSLGYVPIWSLNSPYEPKRTEWSAHPSVVPSRMFRTSDGFIYIMCQTEKFWEELCNSIGKPELLQNPLYQGLQNRFANKSELENILESIFISKRTEYWIKLLSQKVPIAPVNDINLALNDSQLQQSGLIQKIEHPTLGPVSQVGAPFCINEQRGAPLRAPLYGEHTKEAVTRLANISESEFEQLVNNRTVQM